MEKAKSEVLNTVAMKRKTDPIAALHPQHVFQALLRRERSRSNRDGSEFSLAVFDVSRMGPSSASVKQIAGYIQEKMRSIDEVGWLDAGNIAVILPATNLTGGQTFAARVSASVLTRSLSTSWLVYTYPTHWLLSRNGDSRDEPGGPAQAGSISDTEKKRSGHPDAEARAKRSDYINAIGQVFCLKVPVWKRCLDIMGSLVLIALLSPLFLIVAAYIKIASPGKVLFRQKRVGYQGKLFTFMKFRTMKENNDPGAHRNYLKELIKGTVPMEKLDGGADPRIIPGGKILRVACVDELPQLFNVLQGEMSLVGPRPCIPYEAEEYLRWHNHRFDILPGMTGLWQVSGKNRLTFEQMIRLDIAYMKRMSLLLDLKILLLTLPTVIGLLFEAALKKIRNRQRGPSSDNGTAKGSFRNA